ENATISVNSASKAASYSKAPAGLYALSRGAINLAGGAAITMADINHFQAAGGVPVLMRELLNAGLLHEDVNTVAGFGLKRYTL
ncbi:dihydroxy-acid dehydratase, partial [Salmonella enterica subsp. enterica serovar Anatum]|nr:dihydroxy-acid dehydratase [Salmonella enterica subsp. enterica serovar Anatum]